MKTREHKYLHPRIRHHNFHGYNFTSFTLPKSDPVDLENKWCMVMPKPVRHNNGAIQVVNHITAGTIEHDETGKVIFKEYVKK